MSSRNSGSKPSLSHVVTPQLLPSWGSFWVCSEETQAETLLRTNLPSSCRVPSPLLQPLPICFDTKFSLYFTNLDETHIWKSCSYRGNGAQITLSSEHHFPLRCLLWVPNHWEEGGLSRQKLIDSLHWTNLPRVTELH